MKYRFACCIATLFATLCLCAAAHGEDGSVSPTARPLSELGDAEFAFVQTIESRVFWVSKLEWSRQALTSAPQTVEQGVAFAKVSKQKLPQALKSLVGRSVQVYGRDPAQACTAKLQTWGVLSEFDAAPEGDSESSEAQLVAQSFAHDSSARLRYAVEIAPPQGCPHPLWARLGSLPAVPTFPVTELKGKALAAERSRFRKTSDYAEAQQRFAEQSRGQWDMHRDTNVSAYACTIGDTRYTLAHLQQFNDCESFSADVVLVFRGSGKNSQELSHELSGDVEPLVALDLNGDAMPEWLTPWSLIGWNGSAYTIVVDNTPNTFGCPC